MSRKPLKSTLGYKEVKENHKDMREKNSKVKRREIIEEKRKEESSSDEGDVIYKVELKVTICSKNLIPHDADFDGIRKDIPDRLCYICEQYLDGSDQMVWMEDLMDMDLYYTTYDSKRAYCRNCFGEIDKQIVEQKKEKKKD